MKLKIEREKWLRGEGSDASRLLRTTDAKMCCIGFLCLSCGLASEDIENRADVYSLLRVSGQLPTWMQECRGSQLSDIERAYSINDDRAMPESDRESRLTAIFAKHDIEVEFV